MGSWEPGEPRDGGGSSSSKAAVIQRDSGISPVRKTPGAGHGVGDDWDWSEAQGMFLELFLHPGFYHQVGGKRFGIGPG